MEKQSLEEWLELYVTERGNRNCSSRYSISVGNTFAPVSSDDLAVYAGSVAVDGVNIELTQMPLLHNHRLGI